MERVDCLTMRGLIVEFLLLLTALTSQSLAQALPSIPEPAKDPFVGKWKANADKSRALYKANAHTSQPLYNDAPGSDGLQTLSRDGDYLISSYRMFDGEHRDRMRCDGVLHPVEPPRQMSCTYLAANRIEGVTVAPSSTQSTFYWTHEVSPDGQEMTFWLYLDKARKKMERVWVRDRVK